MGLMYTYKVAGHVLQEEQVSPNVRSIMRQTGRSQRQVLLYPNPTIRGSEEREPLGM